MASPYSSERTPSQELHTNQFSFSFTSPNIFNPNSFSTPTPFKPPSSPSVSPNRTAVLADELVATPEKELYAKYYDRPSSASPTPQPLRPLGSPSSSHFPHTFDTKVQPSHRRHPRQIPIEPMEKQSGPTGEKTVADSKLPDTSSQVEETEITISDNPLVKIIVPTSVSSNPEFVEIIRKATSLGVSAAKKELELQERALLERGFRAGAKVTSILIDQVEEFDPPESFKRDVRHLTGAGSPTPPPTPPVELWTKPTFMMAYNYIKDLGMRGRSKILGYLDDGTEVLIELVGHVDTQWTIEDKQFFGLCEIGYGDTKPDNQGFVLGSIADGGTALIITQDDELLAYSPDYATDLPWKKMPDIGAYITINPTNQQITLTGCPGMEVFCFDE